MNGIKELSFKFALETSKQLITLTTGAIVFTITFAKDFLHPDDQILKVMVVAGMSLLMLTLLFGFWTFLALTGALISEKPSIEGLNIRMPSMLQITSFFGGLFLLLLVALKTKVLV